MSQERRKRSLENHSPRVCVIGNLLGRNPGLVTTQGQIVADLLAMEGYDVISASSKIVRIHRFFDIVWTILVNRRRIDLMIVEVYSGLAFALADSVSLLCKLLRIPSIFVLHGGNLGDFIGRYPIWVSRTLKRADELVAPSLFLAKAIQRYGFHVRVIPNVLALESYPFRLRKNIEPKLFWMRSFHPIYNPQMALNAFASLKCTNPNATLVMAGADKGLENALKNSAKQLGVADSVRFPGFLDDVAKRNEFSKADIYLNTNRIDNMPVSVVEAGAMGLPVVATDVGGLSHLITHGQNGILVKDDDPNEMAAAIIELIGDPELVERLSKNGRLLAENSSWAKVRKSWEELFDRVLRKHDESDVVSAYESISKQM